MHSTIIATVAALAVAGPGVRPTSPPRNPRIEHCLVTIKDQVEVPAQEPGVLVSLVGTEGMQVAKGQLLGNVDDSQRQMERRQALIEQQAAAEQAENDVNVRYAEAAAKVAEAEYHQALEANRRVRGTFPEAEIRRLKLSWNSAVLQIEQSQVEQRMAVFSVKSRATDVEAADTNIQRRKIVTPVGGEVVAVYRHAGEWVQPGDAVLRVVRFDTLRIEGFLSAEDFDPGEVANRPVTVDVMLARGRRVQFEGRIVYVSSLVQAGGQYRVWAEVTNRQENSQWLLRPGLGATMTIHVR